MLSHSITKKKLLNFLVFICSLQKWAQWSLLFVLIKNWATNTRIINCNVYIFIFCIWMRENCFYINGTFIFVSVKHASWGNFIVKYERERGTIKWEIPARAAAISQTFGNSSLNARARSPLSRNHKRVRGKILHLHFCVEHILKRPNKI